MTQISSDPELGGGPTEPILCSVADGLARITLNNPRRKNAITLDMAAEISAFCDRVERDTTIGAVVVDANGSYFCSGADTRDLASSSTDPASPEAVQRTSAVYNASYASGRSRYRPSPW